ncbi:MAG: hypothetical protein ABI823_16665, partial [Bryobacteraceae bacterium]
MFGIPALMFGVPVGTLLAVFLLKWWLGYLERRGAFPEISGNPMSRSMGNALLEVQAIVEPQKRHVIEMKDREAIRKEEAES